VPEQVLFLKVSISGLEKVLIVNNTEFQDTGRFGI
jgi:hypothetical protein